MKCEVSQAASLAGGEDIPTQRAHSSRELNRQKAANAVYSAALECQKNGNPAWSKLVGLLLLYSRDPDRTVQQQACSNLAGTPH